MVRLLTILSLIWVIQLGSFGQLNGDGKTVIIIDIGHGRKNSGAIGMNEIQERDIVLKIARETVGLHESLFGNCYALYLTEMPIL